VHRFEVKTIDVFQCSETKTTDTIQRLEVQDKGQIQVITLNVILCKIVSVPANNVNLLILLGICDLQTRVWRGSAIKQILFTNIISLVSATVGV
jgi:hypothetical protein